MLNLRAELWFHMHTLLWVIQSMWESSLKHASLSVHVASPEGVSLSQVDEWDALQAPEKSSFSPAVLLAFCKPFIFSSISSSILVTYTSITSPNRTFPKTPLFCSPLPLKSPFSPFSMCEYTCVCISLCIYLSVQFLWHLSSFESFHMVIKTALFSAIIQGVLMYGERHAEQIRQWGWNMNRRHLN